MAIFYFHLHECGSICEDDEGQDLPSMESAMRRAVQGAREIMAAEVMSGRLCLSCYIEVEDRERGSSRSVRFSEVLEITGLRNH